MKIVKVYISCALTYAPPEYKLKIQELKTELQKIPWIHVLEFVGDLTQKPDPARKPLHIYTNDIYECIGTAEAVIGELSLPSTGLGWELGTAVEKHNIKVMMCAQKSIEISYLPLGAALHDNNSNVTFHWYKNSVLELLPYFLEELKKLHQE